MPFSSTPTRNSDQLTVFFEQHLKRPIERAKFVNRYLVRRSDDTFNITEQIIRDLYSADMVICDLSGNESNPNVMYELGIRLAISQLPIILIREAHKDNRQIFDIGGFYAENYDPLNYPKITKHVIEKMKKLESGKEPYASPILKLIGEELPLLVKVSNHRAVNLLSALYYSLQSVLRLYCGEVADTIGTQVKLRLGNTPIDLINAMESNSEVINKCDWKGLNFRPGTLPALDYYLASRYLLGVVGDDVEWILTSSMIEYHATFFSGDYAWRKPSSGGAHQFIGETLLRLNAIPFLQASLLGNTAEERGLALTQFSAVLRSSRLGRELVQ
jgi:hypothetical protein